MIKKIFFLHLFFSLFLLCSCFSVTFWQESGKEKFYIEKILFEKKDDGTIIFTQKGIIHQYPIPFFLYHVKKFSGTKVISKRKENIKKYDVIRTYSFQVEPQKTPSSKNMYGAVLFPHSSWNSAEKLILAPGELEKLKCMPVLFNGNFGFDLMMPLEINYDPENNRGTFIAFVAYRFPEKNHIETENLNNCDIFLWRIFLIPLPFLADVVTSPVQLFSLFLLSLSRK